jgi:hypothetical protein
MNLNGKKRKELVAAVGEILEEIPRYNGVPSFSYEVGAVTIGRDGTIVAGESGDAESLARLVAGLEKRGFVCEVKGGDNAAEARDEVVNAEPEVSAILIPLDGFNEASLQNLRLLIGSKATLICKAFGREELAVNVNEREGMICFPWLSVDMPEAEVAAYARFITSLCDMAKRQKRVIAEDKAVENERYAMRCFLLRLGFIGEEYAEARKILLRNLSGNGSWKDGAPKRGQGRAAASGAKAARAIRAQAESVEGTRFSLRRLLGFLKK